MSRQYQPGDYEARHDAPVWRDRADFIVAANISDSAEEMKWEQLWARRLSDNRFEICCIPFFAYDLALGDEVQADENNVIGAVVRASGHFTFRVWMKGSSLTTRSNVKEIVTRNRLLHEWSSDNLLAIDTPDHETAEDIANFLQEQEQLGRLTYETGRS